MSEAKRTLAISAAIGLTTLVVGTTTTAGDDNYSPYAERAFPTELLFGETHVHSALSADAGGGGTKLMPRDVYRFARGDQLLSNSGQPVRLRVPLTFLL